MNGGEVERRLFLASSYSRIRNLTLSEHDVSQEGDHRAFRLPISLAILDYTCARERERESSTLLLWLLCSRGIYLITAALLPPSSSSWRERERGRERGREEECHENYAAYAV